jgi:hypothetical protein
MHRYDAGQHPQGWPSGRMSAGNPVIGQASGYFQVDR